MLKRTGGLAVCAILICTASAWADGDPLAVLRSTTAPDEVKATDALVAAGQKYLPQIEELYGKLAENQPALRQRCRQVVARIRAAEAQTWVAAASESLAKGLAWDDLARSLGWQAKLATADDGRIAVCRLSRNLSNWPEAEAATFFKPLLGDPSAALREAAVAALDREAWKGPAAELIVAALKDESVNVRAAAGLILLGRGDSRGLSAVLAGAAGAAGDARSTCGAVLGDLIVSEEGKPQCPRYKLTADNVAALTKLIYLDDVNARGTAIRLLGMAGDKSAGPALLEALGKEEVPKNRRRICTSLGQLRHRPAAAPLVKLVEAGLKSSKQDYGWAVAGCWAQIGDPDTVPAMMALLGNANRSPYAAVGLSWAFGMGGADEDYSRGDGPTDLLVPTAEGKLEQRSLDKAPKAEDLKKAWEAYWTKNKDTFKWADGASTLKGAFVPPPAKTTP